jgi:hypothetical protein
MKHLIPVKHDGEIWKIVGTKFNFTLGLGEVIKLSKEAVVEFSDEPVKKSTIVLEYDREHSATDYWYKATYNNEKFEFFLCDTLLHYFNPAPKKLYVTIK